MKKGDEVIVPSWAIFQGKIHKIEGSTVYVLVRNSEKNTYVVKRFHVESVCPVIHQTKETIGR